MRDADDATTGRRAVKALVGERLVLPRELLVRWPELDAARYRRGGLPPRIGGWMLGASSVAAIALGRTIWLAADQPPDPALLLHEIRHVQQWGEERFFVVSYLWQTLTRGYAANRYEEDARRYAARRIQEVGRAAGEERSPGGARSCSPTG